MDESNLKDRVKDYWNRETCGTRYGKATPEESIDLIEMAKRRYELEPYILDFADFEHGRDKKVLEIGVGGGADFHNWIRHGAKATGIDLTPAGVELTRQRLDNSGISSTSYSLDVGDAENLPFADNQFEIVYSWGVLHHSPDTERAIQEVCRVLAPGGEFRGMVYHVPCISGWLLWIWHCLLKGKIFKTPRQAIYDHLESPGTKAYTVKEFQKILDYTGFTHFQVYSKLSFGDLLEMQRGEKYQSLIHKIIWALYPRWLVRLLGDRFGGMLMIVAKKG